MSSATVTYHELPPVSSWAAAQVNGQQMVIDSSTQAFCQSYTSNGQEPPRYETMLPAGWQTQLPDYYDGSTNGGDPQLVHWAAMPAAGNYHQNGYASVNGMGLPPPPPMYPARTPLVPVPCLATQQQTPSKKRPSSSTSSNMLANSVHKSAPESTSSSTGGLTPTGVGHVGGQTTTAAPEELCLVCGDKASGYHYNALTCEGCKGFFRRSITRKAMYYCKYGSSCDIDMYMRRKCQACRLRKCLDIGMRPELVIPEDQCRMKRESKMKNRLLSSTPSAGSGTSSNDSGRKSSSPQQVTSTESLSPTTGNANGTSTTSAHGLTPEQRELVHRLVVYQEQYDMPSDEELAKLSTFQQLDGGQTDEGKQSQFQHLAELTILNVQLIMEFTKRLPGFATLSKDDQLTLLKACSTEVLMLRTARRYDMKRDMIVLGNQTTSWAYNRDSYRNAGMGLATDAIFDFAKSMAKMKVDNAEYALLTAITIFSERPGLSEPKKVDDIQEVYTTTLQAYIDVHRPKNRTVFARLLMKLTDLRTLGSEHAGALFGLRLDPSAGGSNVQLISAGYQQPFATPNSFFPSSGDYTRHNGPPSTSWDTSGSTSEGAYQQMYGQRPRASNVRIKVEPISHGGGGTCDEFGMPVFAGANPSDSVEQPMHTATSETNGKM